MTKSTRPGRKSRRQSQRLQSFITQSSRCRLMLSGLVRSGVATFLVSKKCPSAVSLSVNFASSKVLIARVAGLVITAEWVRGSADDSAVEQAHGQLLTSVERIAKEKDLLLDFICPSFANAQQNVLASFGDENLKKYREVASKFDPEGFFQKFQNGGFLLRNA